MKKLLLFTLSLVLITGEAFPVVCDMNNFSKMFEEKNCFEGLSTWDPRGLITNTATACNCQSSSISGSMNKITAPDNDFIEKSFASTAKRVNRNIAIDNCREKLNREMDNDDEDNGVDKTKIARLFSKIKNHCSNKEIAGDQKWANKPCNLKPQLISQFRKIPSIDLLKSPNDSTFIKDYFKHNPEFQAISVELDTEKRQQFQDKIMGAISTAIRSSTINLDDPNSAIKIMNTLAEEKGVQAKFGAILKEYRGYRHRPKDKTAVGKILQTAGERIVGKNDDLDLSINTHLEKMKDSMDLGYGRLLSSELWYEIRDDLKKNSGMSFSGELPSILYCFNNFDEAENNPNCKYSLAIYCKAYDSDTSKKHRETANERSLEKYADELKYMIGDQDLPGENPFIDYMQGIRDNENLYDEIGGVMCNDQSQKLTGLLDRSGKQMNPSQLTFNDFKSKLCSGDIKLASYPNYKCHKNNEEADFPMLNYMFMSAMDPEGKGMSKDMKNFIKYSKALSTVQGQMIANTVTTEDLIDAAMKGGNSNKAAEYFLQTMQEKGSRGITGFDRPIASNWDKMESPTSSDLSSQSAITRPQNTTSSSFVDESQNSVSFTAPTSPTAMSAPEIKNEVAQNQQKSKEYQDKIDNLNKQLDPSKPDQYADIEKKITNLEELLRQSNDRNKELMEALGKKKDSQNSEIANSDDEQNNGARRRPASVDEDDESSTGISHNLPNVSQNSQNLSSGGTTGGSNGLQGSGTVAGMANMNAASLNPQAARTPASIAKLNLNTALLSKYGISVTDASSDGKIIVTEDKKDVNAAILMKDAATAQEVPLEVSEDVYKAFLNKDTKVMGQYAGKVSGANGNIVKVRVKAAGKEAIEMYAIKDNGKLVFQNVKRTVELKNLRNELNQ